MKALDFNVSEFERNLKAIQLLTNEADVEFLVCTQMIDTTGNDAAIMKNRMVMELTSSIKDIAKLDSLTILDFAGASRENLLQSYVHFTPTGCEVFSDSLASFILRERLLGH